MIITGTLSATLVLELFFNTDIFTLLSSRWIVFQTLFLFVLSVSVCGRPAFFGLYLGDKRIDFDQT